MFAYPWTGPPPTKPAEHEKAWSRPKRFYGTHLGAHPQTNEENPRIQSWCYDRLPVRCKFLKRQDTADSYLKFQAPHVPCLPAPPGYLHTRAEKQSASPPYGRGEPHAS